MGIIETMIERWGEGKNIEDKEFISPHGYRFINLHSTKADKSFWVLEIDKNNKKIPMSRVTTKLVCGSFVCINRFGTLGFLDKPSKYCIVMGRAELVYDNFVKIDLDDYWIGQWKGKSEVVEIYE